MPTLYISNEVRGKEMPDALNTYPTKPEQSNPLGVVPPQRYGTPIKPLALLSNCSISPAPLETAGGELF